MSVRRRIILLTSCFAAITAAGVVLVAWFAVVPVFARQEQDVVEAHVGRIEAFLSREQDHLRTKLLDYSQWDEAYRWMMERRGDFPERKFTLVQLAGIHQLTFIGRDGAIAGGVACDDAGTKTVAMDVPADEVARLVAPAAAGSQVCRYLRFGDRLVLAGAAPVLRSDAGGPAAGALLVFRRIDASFLDDLRKDLQGPVELVDQPMAGRYEITASSERLDVRVPITGGDGHILTTIRSGLPRHARSIGMGLVVALGWGCAAVAVFAGLGFGLILDRMVLRRLADLRHRVRTDQVSLINQPGADEIADLDCAITRSQEIVALELAERRTAEENLRRALQQRDELSCLIVHDLRSPLSGIVGSLDLLADAAGTDAQAMNRIRIARMAAQRLMSLINDLLDVERLENGSADLRLSEASPADLAAEAVDALGTLLERHQVRREIPAMEVRLSCDRGMVVRILINLLANAAKFAPAGSEIGLHCLVTAGGVRFTVRDQGPGIPADSIPHLFDRFSRLSAGLDRQTSSGLGLSFVKLAVEAHGGSVSVESSPGSGTAFHIDLPIQPTRR